jgi:organic radical activating enzyme
VDAVLALVRRYRPVHLSIVGGEPLVRYRELNALLPKLERMGVEVQLVTSAVREIPIAWTQLECLHLVVSIDGLPEEHDRRRKPATYERILHNIRGHKIIVHCTITRQLLARPGYLRDFAQYWSERPEARKIWFSLFTPQEGEVCEERLTTSDRAAVIEQLAGLADRYPKVHLTKPMLDGLRQPPASPEECLFAQVTTCVSADLKTPIVPCQFGGRPVCSECGCLASAGLVAVGRYKLAGLVQISSLLALSSRIGRLAGGARAAA